jgi:RNA 2',3'-cyclic 3'-phosphodiesterase
MHRLFVALRPPPDVRDALSSLMAGIEGARWQTDNQLHLTLAFIGETDRHGLQAATDALAAVIAPSLDLRLGLAGTFDTTRPGRTGTLWIGVEPAEPLAALSRSIRTALRRAGLTPDPRKFAPHITLARFGTYGAQRETLRPWLTHVQPPALRWQTTDFHLVESTLGHQGAHYKPVASYPLLP